MKIKWNLSNSLLRSENRKSHRPSQRQAGFSKRRVMKRCLVPLALFVCVLASSVSAQSLFVVTQGSDAIAVIDSSTNQIINKIPVGVAPIRITTSPNRLKAYVSNSVAGTVSVLDTVALTTIATIPVGAAPKRARSPGWRTLFVVHQSNVPVTVIDTATNIVIANVVIGGNLAKCVLFTLDGRFAYIANFSQGTVNVIDTATYPVKTVPTAAGSRRLAISPAGDRVFVTNFDGNSVSAIDTQTNKRSRQFLLEPGQGELLPRPAATRFT